MRHNVYGNPFLHMHSALSPFTRIINILGGCVIFDVSQTNGSTNDFLFVTVTSHSRTVHKLKTVSANH